MWEERTVARRGGATEEAHKFGRLPCYCCQILSWPWELPGYLRQLWEVLRSTSTKGKEASQGVMKKQVIVFYYHIIFRDDAFNTAHSSPLCLAHFHVRTLF